MFTKPWFRCGLAVGASFLAVGAVAASAGNDYVEASSSTPGVVEVCQLGWISTSRLQMSLTRSRRMLTSTPNRGGNFSARIPRRLK